MISKSASRRCKRVRMGYNKFVAIHKGRRRLGMERRAVREQIREVREANMIGRRLKDDQGNRVTVKALKEKLSSFFRPRKQRTQSAAA